MGVEAPQFATVLAGADADNCGAAGPYPQRRLDASLVSAQQPAVPDKVDFAIVGAGVAGLLIA